MSFTIGYSISRGGNGTVHRARWGNHHCAAKQFHFSATPKHRAAIRQELDILRQLCNRHIIQFYRQHVENATVYLVTDIAEKGSLELALRRGELDWPAKTRIAHEIARGLEYIHHEGILHRDIKSANILLTKHMEAKLCDFGSAIRIEDATLPGVSLQGSSRWWAPELVLEEQHPRYSTKSDIFALGMVLWEMAAERRPFNEHQIALIVLLIKEGEREVIPQDTKPLFREWIECCWSQQPEDRPEARDVILLDLTATFLHGNNDGDAEVVPFDFSDGGSFCSEEAPVDTIEQDTSHQQSLDIGTLLQQAEEGNVESQLQLAVAYEQTKGIVGSDADSMFWYLNAALKGNATAQCCLGRMRQQGRGGQQSDIQAARWYREAADQGDAEAQTCLGWLYQSGRGVVQSYAEAASWYRLAVCEKHPKAQFYLGQLYHHGHGVAQSDERAVYYYEKASEQGNADAHIGLGMIYENGRDVSMRNTSVAVSYYRKAADLGHADAQHILGLLHLSGHDVRRNDTDAAYWFLKAANQGNVQSQYILGMLYRKGRGMGEQRHGEATFWLRKAAENNYSRAQYELGRLFQSGGHGVPQSNVDAAFWYRMASKQGHAKAQASLEAVGMRDAGIEKDDLGVVHGTTDRV